MGLEHDPRLGAKRLEAQPENMDDVARPRIFALADHGRGEGFRGADEVERVGIVEADQCNPARFHSPSILARGLKCSQ